MISLPWSRRIGIYVGINEFHEARKLLTEGKRLSAIREYEAAIKVLEEVIEGNPNSAEAWYELAKIHHHQGET
ncbi:MAG: tetratricopeptide repeat protein, partial [Candidatus Thorarchaeota archaeon]|nr:tetratricopeptide repeat protein [Candidatus Thorarchaeota archaeon]